LSGAILSQGPRLVNSYQDHKFKDCGQGWRTRGFSQIYPGGNFHLESLNRPCG